MKWPLQNHTNTVYELNMDGLVGPTHHYAGLAAGNTASIANANRIANPAAAAHQGIHKMRLLLQAGVKQAVLPPHQRPNLELLHQLGFTGSPLEQITRAKRTDHNLLSACYSASSMWAANAATVSASTDTQDGRVHFTAANLISHLHRHQEADFSKNLLHRIFADPVYFQHHPVLPKTSVMGDEGAANHSRLAARHETPGIHLFVYGKQALPLGNKHPHPRRYPARQTLEASQAIARSHQLRPEQVIFACQNPKTIDHGVFHNDVIAVANESVLLLHEDSFVKQASILKSLRDRASFPLRILEISRQQLSVEEAVSSYFFNSQLVTLPNGTMLLIAPTECAERGSIRSLIETLLTDDTNPIAQVEYVDLKQSMRNGGGPACLRLRVPLTTQELAAMHSGVLVDATLLDTLDHWVDKHYRDRLHQNDFDDPTLIEACYTALDELTAILQLGSIYPFQCEQRSCGKR